MKRTASTLIHLFGRAKFFFSRSNTLRCYAALHALRVVLLIRRASNQCSNAKSIQIYFKYQSSKSNGIYLSSCKEIGIKGHPVIFPVKLPEFFIKLLTTLEDVVVDIFSDSNTMSFVAETERLSWYVFNIELECVAASSFKFLDKDIIFNQLLEIYNAIKSGENVNLAERKNRYICFENK